MKKTKLIVITISVAFGVLLLSTPASAQKKFSHAVERSVDAGRIITALAVLPDTGFPQELMKKAEAVAVFPKVKKETALFTQISQGYGVICSRTDKGWTMPAFYQFGGGGYGNPFAGNDVFGVILLFMTKDAVAAFERGGVPLKNEKKALAGPVGTVADEQRKELEGAHILAYAYFNGKLAGTSFGKSFWKNFGLNPDNNINTPLYGMKGREVLAGKNVDPAALPEGIAAYQEALQKYYGANQ